VAWSIAVAALALWATSVPVSWGQVGASAGRLFDDATPTDQNVDTDVPCLPVPAAIQTAIPQVAIPQVVIPPIAVSTPDPNAASSGAQSGTFRLCGGDEQTTAHAIEQLIAGHGFSASLSAKGDGCADLTIRVSPQATSGSASSQLNVSLGSGKNLSIQIVSQAGATSVSIGQS